MRHCLSVSEESRGWHSCNMLSQATCDSPILEKCGVSHSTRDGLPQYSSPWDVYRDGKDVARYERFPSDDDLNVVEFDRFAA